MGIDMNYLMHGGKGSGRTPIKKGGAKNGESKYFIPGTAIRTEAGKDHRAELENEEGNGLGREDPKDRLAGRLRRHKTIDTSKPIGKRGSRTESDLKAALKRSNENSEAAEKLRLKAMEIENDKNTAIKDQELEKIKQEAAKVSQESAKAQQEAQKIKTEAGKTSQEKAKASQERAIAKQENEKIKQEAEKTKNEAEKVAQENAKAKQEAEKVKQEAEKVKQEAGKAVLQTELGKQAELKTKAAEADFNLERRKKKAETKSAEAQAEVQQRLAEKNRLSVARDVETTAASGRKLANDAGSDAKKLIGAVSEKKRTKEAYDLDLSGYSTKDLNEMTSRLNAEAAYRNARIADEGKRTRAAKASVDALSGIAGLAISGVATYYFIKKLKGD